MLLKTFPVFFFFPVSALCVSLNYMACPSSVCRLPPRPLKSVLFFQDVKNCRPDEIAVWMRLFGLVLSFWGQDKSGPGQWDVGGCCLGNPRRSGQGGCLGSGVGTRSPSWRESWARAERGVSRIKTRSCWLCSCVHIPTPRPEKITRRKTRGSENATNAGFPNGPVLGTFQTLRLGGGLIRCAWQTFPRPLLRAPLCTSHLPCQNVEESDSQISHGI